MSNPRFGGPIDDMRWLTCQNVGSMDIPGFAMMQVSGVTSLRGQNVLEVKQVYSLNGVYAINNAVTIKAPTSINPNVGYGNCTMDLPAEVLFSNSTTTPPAVNSSCGPKVGQWYCDATGSGFNFLGRPNITRAWVVRNPGVTIGKVYDMVIPSRAQGNIEIWSGAAGEETDSGSHSLYLNQCPAGLTNGCWVTLNGNCVVQVVNPAKFAIFKLTQTLPYLLSNPSPYPNLTSTLGTFFDGVRPPLMWVAITNGGSDYTSAPAVALTGGGGTGATATSAINSNGQVISVTITDFGTGYTSSPTVEFSAGGGSGAEATAAILQIAIPSLGLPVTLPIGTVLVGVWDDVRQMYMPVDWTGCA